MKWYMQMTMWEVEPVEVSVSLERDTVSDHKEAAHGGLWLSAPAEKQKNVLSGVLKITQCGMVEGTISYGSI